MRLQQLINGYTEALLWSEFSEEPHVTLSLASEAAINVQCSRFLDLLDAHSIELEPTYTQCPTYEYIGHSLYLQQAGHGSGIWDMNVSEGNELQRDHASKLAGQVGTLEFYTGDDNVIHVVGA